MTLVPIGQGLAASVIVALIVCGWIAVGAVFLRGLPDEDEVAAPAAILIGSGLSSFVLALFAAAGIVVIGTVLTALCCAAILVAKRRRVGRIIAISLAPCRELGRSRIVLVSTVTILLVMWLAAISPPRNADAMRYHLAHIRQIVAEGSWTPIADYHYALPFGWSLWYLPFELSGLPQGSQILGVALFVFLVSGVLRALKGAGATQTGILAALVLLLHPAVLRTFSEASADAYALFTVFTVALLLAHIPRIGPREAALLGFMSWIGLQSRYQLAAVAIAAFIVVLGHVGDFDDRRRVLVRAGLGAVAAASLASPFYVANAMHFGNPVWPLLISQQAMQSGYVDLVAYTYSKSLVGSYALPAVADSVRTLLTTPFLFPLAILIIAFIVSAAFSRQHEPRRLGWFGIVFLILWIAMQPLLYPRVILLMLPVAVLCAGLLVSKWVEARDAHVRRIAGAVLVALAVTWVAVSVDSIRYSVTGDARAYHRFTWFHRVYQWVNRSTPEDARFLVIVSSAHSYYLDRPYRRADPWVSGVVDWPALSSGAELDALLKREGYSYMIYEDRDWSLYEGGAAMQRTIRDAIATGRLQPVRYFDERLYRSRIRRASRATRVYVLLSRGASDGRETP